jgi:hypothetical protein
MNNALLLEQNILVKAIKFALDNNTFDKKHLEKLREQGSGMTVKYAHEFYNAHFEANLNLCANVVVGVINLGIMLYCDGNIKTTATILRDEGLVVFFRKGFTAIKNLSKKTELFDKHMDRMTSQQIAELVICEGEHWHGYSEYQVLLLKAEKRQKYTDFLNWCTLHLGTIRYRRISEQRRGVATILFTSIKGEAKSIMSLEEFKDIFIVVNNMHRKDVEQHFEKFVAEKIPKKYYEVAISFTKSLSDDILCQCDDEEYLLSIATSIFNVEMEIDDFVKMDETIFDDYNILNDLRSVKK